VHAPLHGEEDHFFFLLSPFLLLPLSAPASAFLSSAFWIDSFFCSLFFLPI
jgi:hypothetical protein